MPTTQVVEWIQTKFLSLTPDLNERSRRMWAAVEAASLGRGGISAVAAATGMSRNTIRAGLWALRKGSSRPAFPPDRIRQSGGGRKPLTQTYGDLSEKLRSLVESSTRGDPESPLLWTCKSTRNLAEELVGLEFCEDLGDPNVIVGYAGQASTRSGVLWMRHALERFHRMGINHTVWSPTPNMGFTWLVPEFRDETLRLWKEWSNESGASSRPAAGQ